MYVQLGDNKSGEVYVVEKINEQLKTTLSGRNIEIRTKSNSNYIVSYVVESYETIAEDFSASEEVNQYSIKIKVTFVLTDNKNRVISENEVIGSTLYTEDSEKAKEDAIKDLISKYITQIDNNW